jgi:hypothetical protein
LSARVKVKVRAVEAQEGLVCEHSSSALAKRWQFQCAWRPSESQAVHSAIKIFRMEHTKSKWVLAVRIRELCTVPKERYRWLTLFELFSKFRDFEAGWGNP